MTIHASHPFADPEPDPLRRLRGRVGGTVSLWTSGAGADRAGLTVTSYVVVAGDPGRVIGLLDPEAGLTERLLDTGAGVVQLLAWPDRELAEMFAGVSPAPGGAFRHAAFVDTAWGPRLASATSWVGVRVESSRQVGWACEVLTTIEEVEVGADTEPLVHRRGRYLRPQ